MAEAFLARQAIFRDNLKIVGYELLYRESDVNHIEITDSDNASARVIVNTFLNLGMENLVGSGIAFINIPYKFITEENLLPMTPAQLVLELTGDLLYDERAIKGLKRLHNNGYRIAADLPDEIDKLNWALDFLDMVKVDIQRFDKPTLAQVVKHFRRMGTRLVAVKIETQEEFETCQDLGFDYYQGYYFRKPEIIHAQFKTPIKPVIQELLSKTQNQSASIEEIQNILIKDPALCYKLLRYVNCASFAMRQEITSLSQALTLLGVQTIHHWAMLIQMTGDLGETVHPLTHTTLVRARMGWLLTQNCSDIDSQQMFTLGLLSSIDTVLEQNMVDLLDSLPLNTPLMLALLAREGEMGNLLDDIVKYEANDRKVLRQQHANLDALGLAHIQASRWVQDILTKLIRFNVA